MPWRRGGAFVSPSLGPTLWPSQHNTSEPEPARPEYQKVLSAFTDQAHRTSGINCGRGCQAEMVIIIIIISPFCSMRSSFSSLARPVSTPKRDRGKAIVPICTNHQRHNQQPCRVRAPNVRPENMYVCSFEKQVKGFGKFNRRCS